MKTFSLKTVYSIIIICLLVIVLKLFLDVLNYKKAVNDYKSLITKYQDTISGYKETYRTAFSFDQIGVAVIQQGHKAKVNDSIGANIVIKAASMVYFGENLFNPYIIYRVDNDSTTETGVPYDTLKYNQYNNGLIKVKAKSLGKHLVNGALIIPRPWRENGKLSLPFKYQFEVIK